MQRQRMWMSFSVCVLIATLFGVACKKSSSGTGANNTVNTTDDLVGTWNSTTLLTDLILTTSSAQTAPNVFAPANQGIAITGDLQTNLNYVARFEWNGFIITFVADRPFLEILPVLFEEEGQDTFPVNLLTVYNIFGHLLNMPNAADSATYFEFAGGFPYDGSSYTLTANNIQMARNDGVAGTVNASGAVSNTVTNVPANTPTAVLSWDASDDADMRFDFQNDGTFEQTLMIKGETESVGGTWQFDGAGQITLMITHDEGGPVARQTVTMDVELNNGVLDAVLDEDLLLFMEGFASDAECIAALEVLIGLAPGSLTSIELRFNGSYQ